MERKGRELRKWRGEKRERGGREGGRKWEGNLAPRSFIKVGAMAQSAVQQALLCDSISSDVAISSTNPDHQPPTL